MIPSVNIKVETFFFPSYFGVHVVCMDLKNPVWLLSEKKKKKPFLYAIVPDAFVSIYLLLFFNQPTDADLLEWKWPNNESPDCMTGEEKEKLSLKPRASAISHCSP